MAGLLIFVGALAVAFVVVSVAAGVFLAVLFAGSFCARISPTAGRTRRGCRRRSPASWRSRDGGGGSPCGTLAFLVGAVILATALAYLTCTRRGPAGP
jgi:hypothetical protein